MGSKSGGSPTTQTSTTTTELPDYLQPYSKSVVQRADKLSRQPFEAYQGQRVAGLNPLHYGALAQGQNAASQALPGAQNTLNYAAQGGFMNQNPYLDDTFNRAADQIQGRSTNALAQQGLSNSGRAQMLNRDYNDLANQVYGGQYQNDMQNMLGSAQNLPGFAQQSAQFGLGLGDVQRDYEQSLLNEGVRAFTEAQQHPYAMLDVLSNAVRGGMGGGGTTTRQTPGFYQPNSTAGMLGAGALGLGALKQFMGQS